MLELNQFPRAALAKQTNPDNPDQLVKGAPMARPNALSFRPVITALRLILSELADLAGQLIEVGQGTVTIHLDRATLANVFAQIKDALFSK